MSEQILNVLFLCTGNSARSILAEAALNHWGKNRFRAFSAGSHPKGQVHPMAIELLQQMKLSTAGLRSKSWNEFAQPGASPLDFVFTVCDNAAGEVCPIWPGQPVVAHWGVEDPAVVAGGDEQQRAAFRKTYREIEARIKIFINLPLATLEDKARLKARMAEIGTHSIVA